MMTGSTSSVDSPSGSSNTEIRLIGVPFYTQVRYNTAECKVSYMRRRRCGGLCNWRASALSTGRGINLALEVRKRPGAT
jgi:hypothetical protein